MTKTTITITMKMKTKKTIMTTMTMTMTTKKTIMITMTMTMTMTTKKLIMITIGNLRTTTKFTTTTSVDWEKTGTRTSVSAGKRKVKMQSVDDDTECKHRYKTVMFVRNKVFRNGVFQNNARSYLFKLYV